MTSEITSDGTPEKAGVWEDFIDIFHSPSEVFARRQGSGYWVQLAIVAVLATFLSFASSRILQPVMDADERRHTRLMLEQQPGLDPLVGQGAMEWVDTLMTFSAGFFEAGIVIVVGLVLFAGAKVAGSSLTPRAGILIASYAVIVLLLQDLVAIIEGFLRGPSTLESMRQLSWSPARLLDPASASPPLAFLAGLVDVFTLWWLALLAIGLAVLGRMPRSRAATVVISIWAIVTVPSFAMLLIS